MSPEATAVLDPEPATPDEATPEEEIPLPESEPSEEPETEEPTAPETEQEPKSYTQEDVDKLLKDAEARLNESARRKQEAAQKALQEETQLATYTKQTVEAEQTLSRNAWSELANAGSLYAAEVVKALQSGKDPRDRDFPGFNPQWFVQMGAKLTRSAFDHQYAAIDQGFEEYVETNFKDWKPDREVSRAKELAIASKVPKNIVTAQFNYMRAALRSDPTLREEIEKEIMDKLAADGKVSVLTEADGTRKATSPRPARATGSPGRAPSATEIIASRTSSLEEKRQAFIREHGYDPMN